MNEDQIRDGLRRAGAGLPRYGTSVDDAVGAGRRRRRRTALAGVGAALLVAAGGTAGALALTGRDDSTSLDIVTPPTSSVPDTMVAPTTTATIPTVTTSTAPTRGGIAPAVPPILLADGDTVVRWTPAGTQVLIDDGPGAITAAFGDLRGGLVIQTTDEDGAELVRWYPAEDDEVTLREATVHDVIEIDGEPTAIISRRDGNRTTLDELTLATASARIIGTFDAVADATWDGYGYFIVTVPELGCDALASVDRFGEERPFLAAQIATECNTVDAVEATTAGPDGGTILLYRDGTTIRAVLVLDLLESSVPDRTLDVPETDRATDVDSDGEWLVVARGREQSTLLLDPDGTTTELPPAIGASFAVPIST